MLVKADTAPAEGAAAHRDLAVSGRTLGWIVAIGVAAATAILSLSAFFWMMRLGLSPLGPHTEFFAYSWIYAIRWGAGEQVFLPHSQILVATFALINWALDLSRGSPRAIVDGWAAVSFWWPLFLMSTSLAILYASMARRGLLANAAFSSLVFIAAVPLYLDDSPLLSTSYHSLAIPLALLGLLFWKQYAVDAARNMPVVFFVLLGLYTATCALGKPTFVAFAAPFFAMEALKALRARSTVTAGRIALAAGIAVLVYAAAIVAFYHQGFGGLPLHLAQSEMFMTSQYHWYDAAKGQTPVHWYFGYVIGVMGWLPTALLVASFIFATLGNRPMIVVTGVAAGFLAALCCLYFRSQFHAHPEFIAAAATATIGAFRCAGFTAIGRRIKIAGLELALQLANGLAAIAALLLLYPVNPGVLYPLKSSGHDSIVQLSKFDPPILDALFPDGGTVHTLVVMNHPDIFPGSADAWCRGGTLIFYRTRSAYIDRLFPDIACANYLQAPTTDLKPFHRVVFLQRAGSSQDGAIADLVAAFPQASGRLRDCRRATPELPDTSFILQCELAAAIARN
jgi:hypothetical protein